MAAIPSLRGMYVFGELARQQSFQGAGRALGITRSSVSQQVARLEEELGLRLVIRTGRRISLTPEGEVLAARCQELQRVAQLAVEEVEEYQGRPQGPLCVTAPHALEAPIVVPTLARLCADYPDIVPRVITSDEPIDLTANQVDIAIRVGPLVDSDLMASPLGEVAEVLVASPAYLARFGAPESIADLASHRWISTPWQRRRAEVTFLPGGQTARGAAPEQMLPQQEGIQVSTLPSAASLAVEGLGIAFLPSIFAATYLADGRLLRVLSPWRVRPRRVHAVHAYARQPTLKMRRFIALARECFAEHGTP